MQCRYCGKKVSAVGKDICSNCYGKRKRVRQLLQITERIKDYTKENKKRSGQK